MEAAARIGDAGDVKIGPIAGGRFPIRRGASSCNLATRLLIGTRLMIEKTIDAAAEAARG